MDLYFCSRGSTFLFLTPKDQLDRPITIPISKESKVIGPFISLTGRLQSIPYVSRTTRSCRSLRINEQTTIRIQWQMQHKMIGGGGSLPFHLHFHLIFLFFFFFLPSSPPSTSCSNGVSWLALPVDPPLYVSNTHTNFVCRNARI